MEKVKSALEQKLLSLGYGITYVVGALPCELAFRYIELTRSEDKHIARDVRRMTYRMLCYCWGDVFNSQYLKEKSDNFKPTHPHVLDIKEKIYDG